MENVVWKFHAIWTSAVQKSDIEEGLAPANLKQTHAKGVGVYTRL